MPPRPPVDAASVSVVIPGRDRRPRLERVLRALESLHPEPPAEVVVVDDGSRDDTVSWLCGRDHELEVQVVQAAGDGPARARNLGVHAARSPWVAFLGDDTEPEPDWLRCHLERLSATEDDGRPLASLGYTRWHPDIRVTSFLDYLNEGGLQFGYQLIEEPDDAGFPFFYTSNLLVPRALLLEEPFYEAFPHAAWEDTELAYRLTRRGLRILYTPEARVAHDHPTDLRSFMERQRRAGYASVVFATLHPELGSWLGVGDQGPPPPLPPRRQRALQGLVRLLEPLPLSLPDWWYEALRGEYILGMRQGWLDGLGPLTPGPCS